MKDYLRQFKSDVNTLKILMKSIDSSSSEDKRILLILPTTEYDDRCVYNWLAGDVNQHVGKRKTQI